MTTRPSRRNRSAASRSAAPPPLRRTGNAPVSVRADQARTGRVNQWSSAAATTGRHRAGSAAISAAVSRREGRSRTSTHGRGGGGPSRRTPPVPVSAVRDRGARASESNLRDPRPSPDALGGAVREPRRAGVAMPRWGEVPGGKRGIGFSLQAQVSGTGAPAFGGAACGRRVPAAGTARKDRPPGLRWSVGFRAPRPPEGVSAERPAPAPHRLKRGGRARVDLLTGIEEPPRNGNGAGGTGRGRRRGR